MRDIVAYIETAATALSFHIRRTGEAWLLILAGVVILAGIPYALYLSSPKEFSPGTTVVITSGESAVAIAQKLGEARVVRHPELLRLFLRLSGRAEHIPAGPYRFSNPVGTPWVAYRLITGAYGIPAVRITFFEGETAREMAQSVAEAFPDITEEHFRTVAEPYEGYLFPDTYLFSPSSTAESIVDIMRATFEAKTASLFFRAHTQRQSVSDILTLASLIEKEARHPEDRRMISGILYNRLALDMPLQVDAVFGYIFNRGIYSPSLEDLKVDSPYNTYRNKGLPPGPIGNPGLGAIEAALYPAETDYLYYLTGRDGEMRYATTYTEHQANIRKYLR